MVMFTVIFSNDCDLSKYRLGGNIEIQRYNRIQNDDTCIASVPIMGRACGLCFKQQRPTKVIVVEPKVIPNKYYEWLLRVVIPTGSKECKYQYNGSIYSFAFETVKEFQQFIKSKNKRTLKLIT